MGIQIMGGIGRRKSVLKISLVLVLLLGTFAILSEVLNENLQTQIISTESSDRLVTSYVELNTANDALSFCPDWPKTSIDTPTQVRIGEEFAVHFSWTYVTDNDKMEVDRWPEMCYENKIGFIINEFVEIIDDKYVFVSKDENWNVVPAIIRNIGYIPLDFENTKEHTETIKMKINDPRFNNISGHIQFVGGNVFDRYLHIEDEIVTFYDESQMELSRAAAIPDDDVPQETLNMTTINAHPNTNPDTDFRPSMDALADFLEEYYPDVNPEEVLRDIGISEDYIKDFLENYPELNKQEVNSLIDWLIPKAIAGPPPFTFVSGQVFNTNEIGVVVPIKNAHVCFWDEDASGFIVNKLFNGIQQACTFTDSTGSYSAAVPLMDPDNDGTTSDLVAEFKLENENLSIVRLATVNGMPVDDFTHNYFGDTMDDIPDFPVFNYGITLVDELSEFRKAVWIFDTLTLASDWFEDILSYDVPFVEAFWDEGIFRATHYEVGNNRIEYNGVGFPLALNSDEEFPDTIHHEYGHHVMASVYASLGSNFPSATATCFDGHSPLENTDDGCAWVEGWASFVPLAVKDDSDYIPSGLGHVVDYENGLVPPNPVASGPFPPGADNEGWVTAALWDKIDNTPGEIDPVDSDKKDDIANGLPAIWQTFGDSLELGETVIANSILDFKDDWDDEGFQSLAHVYFLNTLVSSFEGPPDPPDPVTSLNEDFQTDLSLWTLSGDGNWVIQKPDVIPVPDHNDFTNKVANAQACMNECIMTLNPVVDLTQFTEATLSFWRFVDAGADGEDGIKVEVSTNGGTTWEQLVYWCEEADPPDVICIPDDDNEWNFEIFDLNSYLFSSNFKLRFTGISGIDSEDMQIDDVVIGTPPLDASPPLITITSPNNGETIPSSSVTVTGTASDAQSGIDLVQVSVDGGVLQTATGTTLWSIDLTGLSDGPHTITATATNGDGLSAIDSITITNAGPEDLDMDGIADAADPENIMLVSKTLTSSHTLVGKLIVPNGVTLTVPLGLSITLPSSESLMVELGGRVIVVFGGNIFFIDSGMSTITFEQERFHTGIIVDSTDDNDCIDADVFASNTIGSAFQPVYIKIKSSGVNDCNVGLREWDVSSIPDNAEIISVEWIASFHQNPGNQYPSVCDVVQIDTRPSTATNAQSFLNEIDSNPAFLNDDTFCSSGGAKTVNLGPSAAAHLENTSLSNDWFAFAIKGRPDASQQVFHQSSYTDELNNPTSLRVVYSIP